nr:MAG TPA: hypothetical protein [Bacteriophage sp.]
MAIINIFIIVKFGVNRNLITFKWCEDVRLSYMMILLYV